MYKYKYLMIYLKVMPTNYWGMEHYIVQFPNREADFLKLLAFEADTEVRVSGLPDLTLFESGEAAWNPLTNPFTVVFSDKPIMVGQFARSRDAEADENDPAMIVIPRKFIVICFVRYTLTYFFCDFVKIN